ncbi:hypothetical protein Tco_1541546, partial [Tanacetum coccineum]
RALINAEAEKVHMILNAIKNDIYSILDACPNAKEMWIEIERLQQGEFINIHDVKTKLFWEFGKFTLRGRESIESYYTRSHAATKCKGKEIVKAPSPPPKPNTKEDYLILPAFLLPDTCGNFNKDEQQTMQYENQRVIIVVGARESVGTQECRLAKRVKDYAYHKEKIMLSKKEAEVIPATYDDTGPTHDTDPLVKVQLVDDYNVFANEREHIVQPETINGTYVVEQADKNIVGNFYPIT